jgi:hypothetical protein
MFTVERFRVLDFGRWKASFDEHIETRVRHSAIGHRIFLARNNQNAVTLMLQFASAQDATSLEHYDPALLDAIRRGTVAKAPYRLQRQVEHLNIADTADYTSWPYT